MSDDFKQQLKDYEEGKLSEKERVTFEKELEKMEVYQSYLEEHMPPKEKRSGDLDKKSQTRVIRKGKWKARIQNTWTVLAVLFLLWFAGNMLGAVYYSWGEPNRFEVYRDVIRSTIAVTKPNLAIKSSGTSSGLTMDFRANLTKRIGSETESIGEINMEMLLGMPLGSKIINTNVDQPFFVYPPNEKINMSFSWKRLAKLPKGTVAEVFLSFDQLYSTSEVLNFFEGKNIMPVWFAADTGVEKEKGDVGPVDQPFGFPQFPVIHSENYNAVSSEESGGILMGSSSKGGGFSIEVLGDAEKRNENFIQSLRIMAKYNHIAREIVFGPDLDLAARVSYLEENGVHLYGVVITGPSKEILNLKEEDWVAGAQIGEVRLWNWRS